VIGLSAFDPSGLPPGVTRCVVTAVDDPPAVLPLIAVTGASPGPTFMVTGGVHGDEYEGPQAIWRIARDLSPSSLRGTLLMLPVCNPWAYAEALRATPESIDGLNLARVFPGDAAGSPTLRLADALLEFVMRVRPALFLDLHSGGVRYRFLQVVGYRAGLGDDERAREASRAFGLPNLWELKDHPGTFNSETARRGVLTVGVEMSGMGGCLDEDVEANCQGILNLMRWLGMLRDRAAPQVAGSFWQTTQVASPSDGFAVVERAVGQPVDAGQTVAGVVSALGEHRGAAVAPHSGRVWVTRHVRKIGEGEMICTIAAPAERRAG
jgi:predicted deacylase